MRVVCLHRLLLPVLLAGLACGASAAKPAPPFPADISAALRASGLPLKSFGFDARRVDGDATSALATLNADQPFTLASTAKLVTSLAALDLLGAAHRWETEAYATGPVSNGRLRGNLVIVGGQAGLTPTELARWFKQMRGEGLTEVSGNIVLERVPLLHEELPAPTAAAAVQREPVAAPDPRRFHEGALLVAVRPTGGERAEVSVQPRPLGMTVLNDVFMGGGCAAWAQWHEAAPGMSPRLWVRGRWDAACGQRDIAFVRPLAAMKITRAPVAAVAVSNAQLVASLWAQAGGKLRGRVIETQRRLSRVDDARALEPWSSQLSTQLPDVIREMNKNSNNSAARHLFLALSPIDSGGGAQREAQSRMQAWLRGQGLADGDVSLDVGSGQSHLERGKPHALVHLLRNAWRASAAQAFLDSLPIAGVDGTLAQRMRHGAATGQAFLKTGTLRDTRALAGYVRARSGKVYAVAALVNHPEAVRAMPALDKFIEWVANNG